MIEASAGIPEGVDYSGKPNGYNFGTKLSFFIEGEKLVRFDKNSLSADGWKLLSPKISKDFSSGSFTIEKKKDFVNKVQDATVEGKITLIKGLEVATETVTASTAEVTEAGPMKVQLVVKGKNNYSNAVTITGNPEDVKSVSAKIDGNSVLSKNGNVWNDKGTFYIKELVDNAEITIDYWSKTEKVEVAFKR